MENAIDVMDSFMCPITGEILLDPVVASDSVEDMRWLVRAAVNLADEEGEDKEGEDAPADEKAGVDRKKVKDDAPDSAAGVDWKNEPCWDGHTYSRAAIAKWFVQNQTSPLTGVRLTNLQLLPNHAMRKAIEEAREKLPLAIEPGRLQIHEDQVLGEGSHGCVVAGG